MLIFPDPNVETEYTDPNGSAWEFNGTGWVRQCDCSDGGLGPNDPYWAMTSLLLDGDTGPNGANNNYFKDSSANNHAITTTGNVAQGSFSPYGDENLASDITTDGGSAYFDGQGAYLSVPASSNYTFGTADFTIEAWIFNNSPDSFGVWQNCGFQGVADSKDYWFGVNRHRELAFNRHGVGSPSFSSFSGAVNDNEWTHIAVTRTSSVMTLWVNGTSVATSTDPGLTAFNIFQQETHTVGFVVTPQYANGYLSNLRVIKGTALYVSNFTPPTAPLEVVANTSLLLNFQDAGIYDRTGKNNLMTVGNAQIDTTEKKYGTGSMKFGGSGDYLKGRVTPSVDFGSGDWTVESWINLSAINKFNNIVSFGRDQASGLSFDLSDSNRLRVMGQIDGSWTVVAQGATGLSADTWYHVAFVRNGSSFKIYLDGIEDGSGTNSGSITDPTSDADSALRVGYWYILAGTFRYFSGYIDDLRVTKGVARYTSDFTPPPMLLPNTKALLAEREKQMALTRGEVIDETPDPKYIPYTPTDMPDPIVEIDASANDIDFSNDVTTEES